jgi:hypothetical protein
MRKNRPPDTIPCPNIMDRLPDNDIGLQSIMPIMAIFICDTDEYAIIRLISTCLIVANEVYIIDTMHKVITTDEKYFVALGNIGNSTRRKP